MKVYEKNIEAIEILYTESLSEYFNKEELLRRLKDISEQFDKEIEDVEPQLQYNFFKKSCLHKIFKAHERVRLVRHLEKELSMKDEILPKFMYPGLLTYLLLTCFDQLGQDDKGWKFFPDWLMSEKCKTERDEIFEKVKLENSITTEGESLNPKHIASVYNKYHEIYGVKNSFINFLRTLLPKEQRSILLDKIIIEEYSVNNSELKFENFGDELEKEKWLFKTRNNYTHNLITVEKHFTQGYIDLKNENLVIWEESYTKNQVQRVLARESFKKEIEKSILIGIVMIIKNNS